jgi:hypothetical protein
VDIKGIRKRESADFLETKPNKAKKHAKTGIKKRMP